MAVSIFFYCY